MKSFFTTLIVAMAMIVSFCSYAADSDVAYQEAKECFNALKNDQTLQKLREPWEDCIRKFDDIKRKYGRSDEGANATYSLGRLYEGLAENSKNRADWLEAIERYSTFTTRYPTSNMVDDAYFRAGKIYWERLHDKANAEKNMRKVVKFFKTSDMAGEAEKYLANIKAGIVPVEDKKEKIEPKASSLPATSRNFKEPKIVKEKRSSKFTIVIDPGHGGNDKGAVGPTGVEEKDITLALSKQLATDLKKKIPSAVVVLTRDDDRTISLDDRVKFANSNNADFFISMHANASESEKLHGVQTYYLNNASDRAAEKLAAQENKQLGKDTTDLDKIISTMIQNASADESRELASSVHSSLVAGLSKKYSGIVDQKVRSALFYVLVGVKCPSILVETSYISNPKEEKRLITEKYQQTITSSIANGINNRLKSEKSLANNI